MNNFKRQYTNPALLLSICLLFSYCGNVVTDQTVGGCVMISSRGLPASNLQTVSSVVATDGSQRTHPFTKISTAYGVTLLATNNSSNSFMQDIGNTIQAMFTSTASSDVNAQANLVNNLYQYAATIPLFVQGELSGFDFADSKDYHSICDTISSGLENRNDQVLEVIEHVLHIITNAGFHYTLKSDWGINTSSTLYGCMQKAVSSGYYNVSSYESIEEESRNRIKLQEFAYWFISSAWGLQATYGDNDTSEWSLKDSTNLQNSMPTCYTQLITNGSDKMIAAPSNSFLNALGDTHKQ
jgi:hypothetical protein